MQMIKWILMGALFSGSFAFSEEAAVPPPSVRLYTHYELGLLSVEQRVEYIRMLREVIKQAEKDQTNRGVKYATAMNTEFHPWFSALVETAEAQTRWAKGATCVFAGGFSTYGSSKPKSCVNHRPCDGDKTQIQCEPVLYPQHCTRASDGATARCDAELKRRKFDDAILAADLSKPERRKDWESFREQFENFCRGVLSDSKDVNYRSCQRIEARIKALESKIAAKPPEPTVPVPPPPSAAPRTIQRQSQRVSCDKPAVYGCFNCPAPDRIESTKTATEADAGNGKFGQLLKIMAKACAVKNDDYAQGVSAKSLNDLVTKFGVCTDAEYGPAGKFADDKQKKLIENLVSGDPAAHQKMSGGLYYNEYSIAMEKYFGIGGKDAREAFCKGSLAESIQVLRRPPEYYSSGDINLNGRDFAAAVEAKRGPPFGASVEQMEEFKSIYFPRKKLAECIGQSSGDGSRRQVSAKVLVPKSCVLEHVTVNPDVLSHVVKQLVEEAGSTCIEAQGERPVRCDHFNGQALECNAQLPTKVARVSQLKCVSQAVVPGSSSERTGTAR